MPLLRTTLATVHYVEPAGDGLTRGTARTDDGGERRFYALTHLVGSPEPGDRVRLNTTAQSLALGTGGFDVVMEIFGQPADSAPGDTVLGDPIGDEHIVKLRYTPHQHAVRSAETLGGEADVDTPLEAILRGLVVVTAPLHSHLAPIAAGILAALPNSRVACVLTDTAALPLALSDQVRTLRKHQLIATTITCGQAFGGEHECVSLPSALLCARTSANCAFAIVVPGPGNAGTGTRLGFSGIEQGSWTDAASALGATVVASVRASDSDPRARHRGLSHHGATALGVLCARRCHVAAPNGFPELRRQLDDSAIGQKHTIVESDGAAGLELLAKLGMNVSSMGRSVADDPVFFHAASAAGALAADLLAADLLAADLRASLSARSLPL